MFATSAAVLALAAAVAYAQDLSIQAPSLAQASAILRPCLIAGGYSRSWLTIAPTVREHYNQLLWRFRSLLCC